ncbi:MAG: hypothetical protein FWE54_04665 [Methanimicrococcus sp.]|nr:hypothetical protein [Methanimicrococcus sp.]
MKEEKSKWIKYGAIFAILIMVGSATVGVMMIVGWGDNSNKMTKHPFSDIPGEHTNFAFTNIKDGAKYIPEGALQISSYASNETIDEALNAAFPGAEATKVLVVYYPTGMLEYYQLKNENNVSIMISGNKPVYEKYENYNIIYINPVQRIIAGNPIVIASLNNYANDSNLAKRAIDVFTGYSGGSKDFDPIFAYVDDVSDYEEMTVSKSSGSGYSMLYQCSRIVNDTYILETVVYSPSGDMRDDIAEMAAEDSETFSVSEDDYMIKLYIESNDFLTYVIAANNLHGVLGQYNK